MREKLHFFIEVYKLKETIRTGWKIWRIKNPERIAEHIFRLCFLVFLLGKEKGLRLKIALQNALSHDLCEVYAGDVTPLFYYQNLDVKKKKDREILFRGIRLPEKEKRKLSEIKFKNERKALSKLILPLGKKLQNEIFFRWLDYEKGFSDEGKFTRQADWIENLIQSLEYLGAKGSGSGWWEIAEEKVYDPYLLEFLKVIQKKFYKKAQKDCKKNKKLEKILDFLIEIGKLKRIPRLYWKLWEIENPESVAGHIFSVAIMAWILGKEKRELDMEKLLKMALSHEITAIITGDTTPYDLFLPKQKTKQKKVLKKMLHLSKEEKERVFKKEYREEKNAILKLTRGLDFELKNEIINLWKEYRERSSPEGIFLSQVNALALLLQGILYHKKYKYFSIEPLWEWSLEKFTDPICLDFLAELEKFKRS